MTARSKMVASMASHHFVGKGLVSRELAEAAGESGSLIERVTALVRDAELEVVGHRLVEFDNGGLTAVWVLAESHLVLHHWAQEGYATIDLHVCDYRVSNAAKAASLLEKLDPFCFADDTATWRELHLEDPSRRQPGPRERELVVTGADLGGDHHKQVAVSAQGPEAAVEPPERPD